MHRIVHTHTHTEWHTHTHILWHILQVQEHPLLAPPCDQTRPEDKKLWGAIEDLHLTFLCTTSAGLKLWHQTQLSNAKEDERWWPLETYLSRCWNLSLSDSVSGCIQWWRMHTVLERLTWRSSIGSKFKGCKHNNSWSTKAFNRSSSDTATVESGTWSWDKI